MTWLGRMLHMVLWPALVASAAKSRDDSDNTLVGVVIVSRHGIRSPYPAPGMNASNDCSAYTNLPCPGAVEWGMTEKGFLHQYLTPHGRIAIERLGEYYKIRFNQSGIGLKCSEITSYADYDGGAPRDNTTATMWLKGFGCPEVKVNLVDDDHNPSLRPVLSDHFDVGCSVATEEQVNGLYGGDHTAFSIKYEYEINKVMKVLEMPTNASICKLEDPNFDKDNCTLFDLPYKYTGIYYEGMFRSPYYYASYFADVWMFQYLSNLTTWAYGKLTLGELVSLYRMHIENLGTFGANYWNARSFASHQLAYILASLAQLKQGTALSAVEQPASSKLTLLVSHDTNVMFLRQLLDVSWTPTGFGTNVASTGGAVNFELYQDANGEYLVKLVYIIATPEQQRNATKFTEKKTPAISTLIIPGCDVELCPFDTFVDVVLSSIDQSCIQEPLLSSVQGLAIVPDPGKQKLMTAGGLVALILGLLALSVITAWAGWCCRAKQEHSDGYTNRISM